MQAARFFFELMAITLVTDTPGVGATRPVCGHIWATKLEEPHDFAQRRADFRADDKFVVCIKLRESNFVSVWDAPPRGNVLRLFPNVLTHQNNASVRAERLAGGKDHCFGTNFPLYFPAEQGAGRGKLSVIATSSMEDQPSLRDFEIPGETMTRSTMERVGRTYNFTSDCKVKFQESMDYNIAK